MQAELGARVTETAEAAEAAAAVRRVELGAREEAAREAEVQAALVVLT